MIDDFLPLGIEQPGFFANGTKYQAKGRWREGNFVRFHEKTIQPIGGWVQQATTGATIVGIPQAALCWQFEDGTPYVALGTTQGLYIIDENNVAYDITPVSIAPPEYDWQLTNFGAYLIATNSILGDADLTVMNMYAWTGNTAAPAVAAWTSVVGPQGGYSCFATPERQIVVLRGKDPSSRPARTGVDTAYSERRVYFGTTEELDGFVSSDTNEGGDFDLQTPGRLVVGTQGKGQSLIWSDVDLWTMTFIGGQLVYSFAKVGDDCGIVSKRAFAQIDKGAFWMGRGKFFIYDGFTRSIPCEVTDGVFKNFNEQRAHTVWAVSIARFNEITWYYPSAGAQYPDSYVTYNHVENHWVFGKIDRTAGVPKRFNADVIDETKPVFFNSSGTMFQHETGTERDSLAYLESGPIEIQNGDRIMRLQGILDDQLVSGDVQLRIYTAWAADDLETLYGPYALGPVTNLRLKARQVRLRLEELTATSWRVGNPRLSVRPVERRGIGPGAIDQVPASLEIIPDSVTLINAQHYTFQSIVRNAAGQVLDILPDDWTSDNSTYVPIDNNGTVTALATPQTAHIQAFITSPALSSNIATVTVAGDTIPARIVISPTAEALIAASTPVTLTAVVYNSHDQILVNQAISEWDTSDNTKVTIAMGGGLGTTATATGVALGASNLTAKITTPVVVTSNISVATVTDPFVTHTFGASGQFHVTTIGTGIVDRVLVVGGGGSGASVCGTGVGAGGGGAGAAIEVDNVTVLAGDNAVTVGVGGAGVTAVNVPGLTTQNGLGGGPSTFRSHTADGGGAGSASGAGGSTDSASNAAGSGGGGRGDAGGGAGGGAGSAGGHPGGAGGAAAGGGGGGAGSAGITLAGGSGALNDISGTSFSYAGGGFGATITTRTGSNIPAIAGADGSDGFGNGGDGAKGGFQETPVEEGLAAISGAGGDGTVVIRYKVSTGIVATGGVKVVHG